MNAEADALRTAAQKSFSAAEESFQRSDTDGFLSQWALDLSGRKDLLQAEIVENGGTWEFPALFDLDGNLVAAKLIQTRYGMAWALLADDSGYGRFLGFFNPSRAISEERARVANARKGYYVGLVLAPAVAEIMGSGTGLSGAASCYVGVRRINGDFSRDVVITDNGQGDSNG